MGFPSFEQLGGVRTGKLRGAILGVAGLALSAYAGQENGTESTTVDMSKPAGSNIAEIGQCLKGGKFVFRKPPGPGMGETFTVKYAFHVPAAGDYVLAFKGRGPGMRAQSRFSYAVDDGPEREAVSRRVALPADGRGYGWQEQPTMALKEGDHMLELRFHPEQQVRLMNRVNEALDGHAVEIEGIRLAPARPAENAAAQRSGDQHLLWKDGDTVVFFGDSITDEGFYLRPMTRLLQAAYPSERITCINAGISLNRTWEGLERVGRDVIALHPNWAVLAFGVNDGMHMAPDEFKTNYEKIVKTLRGAKIGVVCATPSGMLPALGTDQKSYFHAPDRASAFDRSMEYDAAAVQAVAKDNELPVADLLGAFRLMGPKRAALMANQWHPNDEGGRLMALSILRAVGFSEADVAKSGDARDLELFRLLEQNEAPRYEAYAPREFRAPAWPKGPVVAASSFSRNEVVLADDASDREIARVPVGSHPAGLAYSPKRQTLYIACEGAGQLDALRLPECRLEKPIALGDVYPVAVALSEDENTAWTGNFFGCSISEVDLDTGTVRKVTKVGSLVESLVYLPGQKRLLAATRAGLKLVDPEKGVVEKTLMLTDHHDAFLQTPDGRLYAIDTVNWTKTELVLPDLTAGATDPCVWPGRASGNRTVGPGRWAADLGKGELVRIDDEGKPSLRVPGVDYCFGITTISK